MTLKTWKSISDRFLAVTAVSSLEILSFGFLSSKPACSQIVPDNTLSIPSQVTIDGNVHTIEGGTEAGSNLFHSFQDFSVPTGSEAFFNNATSIENILTRVTGGNLSNIDGLIRANGTANLFLLNPNGIVFGPNARLDIGGSFFGTTADRLNFADGTVFSTTPAETSPLLTVSIPVGLQWGGDSGPIRMQGEGHALIRNNQFFDPIDRSEVVPHLAVPPGRTLALLGSDLDLTGSTVAVSGGNLELGSPRKGTVALTPVGEGWGLDYTAVSEWGNIRLSQQALADVSGEGGTLQVRGANLELRDASLLLVQNSGLIPAEIRIEVTDTILASGTNPEATIASGIANQNLGAGSGANVEIAADHLRIEDGATFLSETFASGTGGSWQIDLDADLEIVGVSPLSNALDSALRSRTVAPGQGGDITVAAEQVRLLDGGSIAAITIGSGMGGNIAIFAESLEIGFNKPTRRTSSVSSASFNAGDGGSTNIDVERLILRDGGRISASAVAEGNGGSITISASESITIDGVRGGDENRPSTVRASVQAAGRGVQRQLGTPPTPSGRGGSVVIDTPNLHLDNHAQINVGNEGPAEAGQAIVRADTIVLDDEGLITAATASGEGGSLTFVSESLQLRDGSEISAEAGGSGNGGNIAIDTETLALLEGSSITANAFEGTGGNIQITTEGIFLSPDSGITASSQLGIDGLVTITQPETDTRSAVVQLSSDPIDPTTQVVSACSVAAENTFVVTGNGGLPPDPTGVLRGQDVWVDTGLSGDLASSPTAETRSNEVEDSSIEPPLVEATGWQRRNDGTIELVATPSPLGNTRFMPSSCPPDSAQLHDGFVVEQGIQGQ